MRDMWDVNFNFGLISDFLPILSRSWLELNLDSLQMSSAVTILTPWAWVHGTLGLVLSNVMKKKEEVHKLALANRYVPRPFYLTGLTTNVSAHHFISERTQLFGYSFIYLPSGGVVLCRSRPEPYHVTFIRCSTSYRCPHRRLFVQARGNSRNTCVPLK